MGGVDDDDDGKRRVAEMIEAAEPWGGRPLDPLPGHESYGYKPGEWRAPGFMTREGLPVECPVLPLGKDGDTYWFIDTAGEVRAIGAAKFNRNMIASLFGGRIHFAEHHWPKLREGKLVTGIAADAATNDLMSACTAKGSWNDAEAVRGRGAWRGPEGQLIIHCGDRLLVPEGEDGQGGVGELELGEHDGFVYPSRPALPGPLSEKSWRGKQSPAATLYGLMTRWNWARPDVDPVLAFGYICAGLLGGALDWRPTIFITGDTSTGKSTLQRLIKQVMGGWLVQSSNTTAAGIYQKTKLDAVAVSVDELEGDEESGRANAVIELARQASQGMLMLRGGADGKGTEFQARSCFAFSAINPPALQAQDRNRIAMLRLKELQAGGERLNLDEGENARIGRALLGRLIGNWHRFAATLADYQRVLQTAGHGARIQDTFGTLLACADLALGADAHRLGLPMGDEDLTPWAERLPAATLDELQGVDRNWRNCLARILTTPVEAWRGGARATVGAVIDEFMRAGGDGLDFKGVRETLAAAGLTVRRPNARSTDYSLFIPDNNPALQRLMYGTKWYGRQDAGGWSDALRQGPDDWITTGQRDRISGWQHRGTCVPLAKICAEIIAETAERRRDQEG